MLLDVAPNAYHHASQPLVAAGESVTTVMSTLASALSAGAQMAGSDSGGQAFATRYDTAAASAVRAGSSLASGLGAMSNLVRTAAHNHGAADSASTKGGGSAAPPAATTYQPVVATDPPSASGGTGDEPDWWHYVVEHVGGLLWPDADTGAMRKVGQAWLTAASGLDSVAGELDEAISLVQQHRSPEVAQAVAAIQRLDTVRSQLAGNFRSVGNAANAYAAHVDDAHSHTTHIMETVLAGLAVTAVVGIGLTLVTFGGSDAAAAAAASAEIAGGAEEVAGVLETCATLGEEAAATAGEVATGAGEAETALAPFEAAEPELAEITEIDSAADGGAVESGPQQVLRADSRGPDEIFENGFEPKGDNMDLRAHVFENPGDSGYVSTTNSMQSAQEFAADFDLDYIYGADAEGIDVNATFGADSPFPWENEISVPGKIEPTSIKGVWGPDGWIPNPGYLP